MKTYSEQQDPTGLLMSEKLDGVQGRWDGRELRTREGNLIHAPPWWTAALPPVALVGEIYLGRGQFDQGAAIVRMSMSATPNPAAEAYWHSLRFMVFDAAAGVVLHEPAAPVAQWLCMGTENLAAFLEQVLAMGGEGVVLRPPAAASHEDCYKLKPITDADAVVTGYVPGTGRLTGLVGALIVTLADGRTMRLGAGLTDDDRRTPPPIGAVVKFEFNGLTAHGLPRFARYVCTRVEAAVA